MGSCKIISVLAIWADQSLKLVLWWFQACSQAAALVHCYTFKLTGVFLAAALILGGFQSPLPSPDGGAAFLWLLGWWWQVTSLAECWLFVSLCPTGFTELSQLSVGAELANVQRFGSRATSESRRWCGLLTVSSCEVSVHLRLPDESCTWLWKGNCVFVTVAVQGGEYGGLKSIFALVVCMKHPDNSQCALNQIVGRCCGYL